MADSTGPVGSNLQPQGLEAVPGTQSDPGLDGPQPRFEASTSLTRATTSADGLVYSPVLGAAAADQQQAVMPDDGQVNYKQPRTRRKRGSDDHEPLDLDRVSRFHGVTWYKASGRWQARLCAGRKQMHLGYYQDEEEAARAYDAAVLQYASDNKNLHINFPSSQAARQALQAAMPCSESPDTSTARPRPRSKPQTQQRQQLPPVPPMPTTSAQGPLFPNLSLPSLSLPGGPYGGHSSVGLSQPPAMALQPDALPSNVINMSLNAANTWTVGAQPMIRTDSTPSQLMAQHSGPSSLSQSAPSSTPQHLARTSLDSPQLPIDMMTQLPSPVYPSSTHPPTGTAGQIVQQQPLESTLLGAQVVTPPSQAAQSTQPSGLPGWQPLQGPAPSVAQVPSSLVPPGQPGPTFLSGGAQIGATTQQQYSALAGQPGQPPVQLRYRLEPLAPTQQPQHSQWQQAGFTVVQMPVQPSSSQPQPVPVMAQGVPAAFARQQYNSVAFHTGTGQGLEACAQFQQPQHAVPTVSPSWQPVLQGGSGNPIHHQGAQQQQQLPHVTYIMQQPQHQHQHQLPTQHHQPAPLHIASLSPVLSPGSVQYVWSPTQQPGHHPYPLNAVSITYQQSPHSTDVPAGTGGSGGYSGVGAASQQHAAEQAAPAPEMPGASIGAAGVLSPPALAPQPQQPPGLL